MRIQEWYGIQVVYVFFALIIKDKRMMIPPGVFLPLVKNYKSWLLKDYVNNAPIILGHKVLDMNVHQTNVLPYKSY